MRQSSKCSSCVCWGVPSVLACVCVRVHTRNAFPFSPSSGHVTDGPPMQKEALEIQVGGNTACPSVTVQWAGVGHQGTCVHVLK